MSILTTDYSKLAVNPKTGQIVFGFGCHASFLDRNYDAWVRVILFPQRKRVYYRFYKPSGDYYFIDDKDKALSFDVCYTANEILIKAGYVKKSWKVLYHTTDNSVTEGDIKL